MNVLEKILEEIEHEIMINKEVGRKQSEGMARAMNIIRSHMEEGKGTNIDSKSDWIPCSERLPNEIEFQEVYCRNQYAADFLVTIKGAPSNWIPCSERLPNEIEFQEAYCRNQYAAEFHVTIKGATRPTTLYFKNNSWFDEQRNYYKVVAWQPLPASYKGEEAAG